MTEDMTLQQRVDALIAYLDSNLSRNNGIISSQFVVQQLTGKPWAFVSQRERESRAALGPSTAGTPEARA